MSLPAHNPHTWLRCGCSSLGDRFRLAARHPHGLSRNDFGGKGAGVSHTSVNVAVGPDARRVQRPHSHLEDKPMVGEQIRARVEEEMCGRGGVGGVGSSGGGGARRSSKEWSRRAREV